MNSSILPRPSNGETVLVTGANGFVGSHIIDRLLRDGFKVRGTVRDTTKKGWVEATFHQRHDPALFTVVVVPELAATGACDEAITGCWGVIHPAADLSFQTPADVIVPAEVNAIESLLASAAKTPSVERFVYTSTINAAHSPKAHTTYHATATSWNEDCLQDAFAPPPHPPNQSFIAYSAAKVQAERAGWAFVKEKKPGFAFNVVLTNFNMGPNLFVGQGQPPRSGAGAVQGVYYGVPLAVAALNNDVIVPPQQMVDVRDTARVHVATLRLTDVENERLFSAAEDYDGNRVLRIMKSFAPPDHVLPEENPELATNGQTVDDARSLELLKRAYGQEGWAPVAPAIRECCLGEGQ